MHDPTPSFEAFQELPDPPLKRPRPSIGQTRRRRAWITPVSLYLGFLAVYAAVSGSRLNQPSQANHFVYLADSWLKGQLSLASPPPNENDWALVDVLELIDGRTVKGRFSRITPDRFYPLQGPPLTVRATDIKSRDKIRYVSFPPLPAVLMLPFVAIWGLSFNDVMFSVLLAALNPTLLFLLLRNPARTRNEDLWLTGVFGLGSVYFYSACQGEVWYTAHMVALPFAIGYAWASIDAARPVLAGLCLGLGYASRTPMAFMFPLFVWEAVRATGGFHRLRTRVPRALVMCLVRFAAPAAVIVALLFLHNYARFERLTVFGHEYLNIPRGAIRIEMFGLFNYHFLSRNLTCALTLTPRLMLHYPWVQVSWEGMSLLITSPNLVYVLLPKRPSPLIPGLAITAALMAIPGLFYQNSGRYQFGYRFSIDYLPFLLAIVAVGNRRLSWLFKALAIVAVAVNLFGAITFDRYRQFSYNDTFFPHGDK
jgi:hypothetical protein